LRNLSYNIQSIEMIQNSPQRPGILSTTSSTKYLNKIFQIDPMLSRSRETQNFFIKPPKLAI